MKRLLFLVICSAFMVNVVQANESEVVKYFKTMYYNGVGITHEISEDEYNESPSIILYNTSVITEYKHLKINVKSSNVNLILTWRDEPVYRSYDVIALRGANVSFNNASLLGYQYYNNGSNKIIYDYSSNNTKKFSNGIGVSMNMVDNATDYIMSLSVDYSVIGSSGTIYGSYQHSQRDITLAQSKNYSLSPSGYGNVILFDSSVAPYFDGMTGVSISV